MGYIRKYKIFLSVVGAFLVTLIILYPPVHERENRHNPKKSTHLTLHFTAAYSSASFVISSLERFSYSGFYLKKSLSDKIVFKSPDLACSYFSYCRSVQPQYRNDSALSLLVYKCVLRI